MCERASTVEAPGIVEVSKGRKSAVCASCLDHFFGLLRAHAVEQMGPSLAVDGSSDVVKPFRKCAALAFTNSAMASGVCSCAAGDKRSTWPRQQALETVRLLRSSPMYTRSPTLGIQRLPPWPATEGAVVFGHDHEHALAEVVFNDTRPGRSSKRVVLGQALRGARALLPRSSTVLSGLTRLARGPRLTRLLLGCRLGPAVGGGLP
ncbi:MAG: hypothetical protein CM15mP18_0870 [Methanobacteriota archaeon]|nr:MAG: hypothetical protein CM15mP18_0870 [Euryarchaeota archaeon]